MKEIQFGLYYADSGPCSIGYWIIHSQRKFQINYVLKSYILIKNENQFFAKECAGFIMVKQVLRFF
jgi:hypothetical protein